MIRYDFSAKTVLVTGSSRGIGAAILEGFALAGAGVWLHYWDDPDGANRNDALRLAEKLRALCNDPNVVSGDVRKPEDVQGIMNLVQQRSNGLDILVNNAGIIRDKTIRKLTLDDWRDVMDVNLNGVFHCCKHAVELLRDNGRIVNIASIAGLFLFHGQANYAPRRPV